MLQERLPATDDAISRVLILPCALCLFCIPVVTFGRVIGHFVYHCDWLFSVTSLVSVAGLCCVATYGLARWECVVERSVERPNKHPEEDRPVLSYAAFVSALVGAACGIGLEVLFLGLGVVLASIPVGLYIQRNPSEANSLRKARATWTATRVMQQGICYVISSSIVQGVAMELSVSYSACTIG